MFFYIILGFIYFYGMIKVEKKIDIGIRCLDLIFILLGSSSDIGMGYLIFVNFSFKFVKWENICIVYGIEVGIE